MNIDVVDVRLDERKLPYLVSETVAEYRGEYVGEQRLKVNSPEKVVKVLNNVFHMKDFSEEKLYVMFLSASLHVIAYAEVSHGVIDSATVGIREIMQRALLTNAAGIILAHNHPGLGSTANPSTQDIDVTQGLMRACEIMGIHMFDHIIVAGNDYYSFREKHAEVRKNNGLLLHGISIYAPGSIMAPTIYIDGYIQNGYSVEQICDEVTEIYEENGMKDMPKPDFEDFSKICGKICMQLVNAEKNRELLEKLPHRIVHDMAVIYYILLGRDAQRTAVVKITNDLVALWGIDEEELNRYARRNTKSLLHVIVTPLQRILFETKEDRDARRRAASTEELMMEIVQDPDWQMYIMTNKQNYYGAVNMLYQDVLKIVAEKLNANLYILPSSVHEVLIVPESSNTSAEELYQMVCKVNRTEVSVDDFLTDNVYYYNREKNTLNAFVEAEE